MIVTCLTLRVVVHSSETHGATQYFVEQTEDEVGHLDLPVYALHDFGNCSKSLSLSRSEVLQTCGFTVRSLRCEPQYLMSVLCAREAILSTSRPSPTATTPSSALSASTGHPAISAQTSRLASLGTASSIATAASSPPSLLTLSMQSPVSTTPSVTTKSMESEFCMCLNSFAVVCDVPITANVSYGLVRS